MRAYSTNADQDNKCQHDSTLDGRPSIFVSEEICQLLDEGTHGFTPVTGDRIQHCGSVAHERQGSHNRVCQRCLRPAGRGEKDLCGLHTPLSRL